MGLAIRSDGAVVGWGRDDKGQASGVPSGNDFVLIEAANVFAFAQHDNGQLDGWGGNTRGELNAPPNVANYQDVVASYNGWVIGLKDDGSLIGWGNPSNNFGQIDDIPTGNDFVAVDAGLDHALALKATGSIVGWGRNLDGEIDVPAGNDFVAVSAGQSFSIALKEDGSIVGWGHPDGRFGLPIDGQYSAVSAGGAYGIALVVPLYPGDTDDDFDVDDQDLNTLLSHFGISRTHDGRYVGDFDLDMNVGDRDLNILLSNFGTKANATISTAIPEPTCLMLLGVVVVGVCRKTQRAA
jgi:alpha-tubulin suppressor-like RCC1 family protein